MVLIAVVMDRLLQLPQVIHGITSLLTALGQGLIGKLYRRLHIIGR